MKMMKMALAAATLAAMPVMAGQASAANLVTNGGFETGSIADGSAGWQGSGAYINNASAHGGSNAAWFGAVGYLNGISQTISTIAGQTYNFSFWFQSDGGQPNAFQALFGNTLVFDTANLPATAYQLKSYTVVATSGSTTITFRGRNDPTWQHLDDVSVEAIGSAVPEPATWAMMLAGVGMMGFAMRRSNRRFDARIKRMTAAA